MSSARLQCPITFAGASPKMLGIACSRREAVKVSRLLVWITAVANRAVAPRAPSGRREGPASPCAAGEPAGQPARGERDRASWAELLEQRGVVRNGPVLGDRSFSNRLIVMPGSVTPSSV